MSLISCSECGKEISDSVKKCPHCGYKIKKVKSEEEKKAIKKKIGIILGSTLAALGVLFCLYFFLSPITVSWCCYHRINSATCTEPQTCHRCGQTWGEPNGHAWTEATCTEAKVCNVCGTTEGNAKGHDWKDATCTDPKTCKTCGLTEGKAKGHSFAAATCTTAKKCRNCGKTEGSKLGHNVSDYICTRCKESFVSRRDVPNILDITSSTYEINYVGGIDKYYTFKNKSSSKTINYITVKLQFLNAVGDTLKDEISGRDYASLVYTGPLKPGKSSGSQYWSACFYNATFSGTVNIQEIKIEYSDGTTLILDESVAREAVVSWR